MTVERIAAERYAALGAAIVDTYGGYGVHSAPEGKVPM
jgi:hypothetical protein